MSEPDDLGALRRSRTRARLVRWAWWIAGAAALLAIAAVAWFSPVLAVTTVTVEGGEIVGAGAVRADAEEQVLGVPLPQVRRATLGSELEAQHPAAQSIEVEYAGLRSLRVHVTDRTPVIAIVDGSTATRFDGGGVRIDEVPADGLELPVLQGRGPRGGTQAPGPAGRGGGRRAEGGARRGGPHHRAGRAGHRAGRGAARHAARRVRAARADGGRGCADPPRFRRGRREEGA